MQGEGLYSVQQSKSTHCSNTEMADSLKVGRLCLFKICLKYDVLMFFSSQEESHRVYPHLWPKLWGHSVILSFLPSLFPRPENCPFLFLNIMSYRSSIILKYHWFPWFCARAEGQLCAKPKFTRPCLVERVWAFFCHSFSEAFLSHQQMSAAIAALNSPPCFSVVFKCHF